MKPLTNRLTEARDLAADREGDIRIKELIRAMSIQASHIAGEPSSVMIDCHFKTWMMYFTPESIAKLQALSVDELATTVAGWIQGAIDKEMLSLSVPPTIYPTIRNRAQVLGA